jgi:hypothetical protein
MAEYLDINILGRNESCPYIKLQLILESGVEKNPLKVI